MMKRVHFILPALLLCFIVLSPLGGAFAQCDGGPQGSNEGSPCCLVAKACGPECPTCPVIPLDGGLSALLVAGIAYGAKRVYGKSK